MQTFLNASGVPLSVAVYLATDHYDFVPDTVSATALMKPIRQQVLSYRVPQEDRLIDVVDLTKSRMGTSIHDGVEKAWNHHYKESMAKLGYSADIINRIVVNPEGEFADDAIPVYMEKRSFKTIRGVTVSGKFDFVAEGRVEDFKSTSTFTWVNGSKDEDYILQGSIYRWLNPDIIWEDVIAVQFFFTDWQAFRANDPKYPDKQVMSKEYPLMSLEDTEAYIIDKLEKFEKYRDADDDAIPLCTDKELWRKADTWKYYKNPEKRTRSTKNCATEQEASDLLAKNGAGVIVHVPGQVVACNYCPAFSVCKQKDSLIADGSLQVNL